MDRLRRQLAPLGVPDDVLDTALAKITVEASKDNIEYKGIDACITSLQEAKIDPEIVDQVRITINTELNMELNCDSIFMCKIMLDNLAVKGLQQKVVKGSKAILDLKVGQDCPEYNPIEDIISFGMKNMKNKAVCTLVASVAEYINGLIKVVDVTPS
jgi:hypothetical protein